MLYNSFSVFDLKSKLPALTYGVKLFYIEITDDRVNERISLQKIRQKVIAISNRLYCLMQLRSSEIGFAVKNFFSDIPSRTFSFFSSVTSNVISFAPCSLEACSVVKTASSEKAPPKKVCLQSEIVSGFNYGLIVKNLLYFSFLYVGSNNRSNRSAYAHLTYLIK